jgi:SAM-dependent methyltransferase
MSSKRDEDAGDMEVGMTTAERRRRRRRGAGLRVPSDNVPRSRTPTAPPAPVPEDPALAMSIAYSFSNDGSGPVPRTAGGDISAPIAPDAMATAVDPPSEDFEMKTREMTAVDLEALGLSAEAASSLPGMRARAAPGLPAPRADRSNDVDIEVTLDSEQAEPITAEMAAVSSDGTASEATPAKKPAGARHQTVALSEEDLEEVRAATAEALAQQQAGQPSRADSNRTMPLSAIDVEMVSKSSSEEPMSVPDIDIQELADRAESSGEIEVDVDAEDIAVARTPTPLEAAVTHASSSPSPAAAVPPQQPRPPRAASIPPMPPGDGRKAATIDAQHAQQAPSTANAQPSSASAQPAAANAPVPATPGAHPPAPPAQPPAAPSAVHPPPTPPKPPAPPTKKPLAQAAVAAVVTKEPSRPTSSKARPWFVDLFDEDYLRTLPFLTPQATQAEAEFVINAMNLAPGAQVLDLGCGYGRHAMELAARGFHVVGLDLSTPLLVRGGEEAHRRGLTINFVRGDMRELDFEGQFDAVYCLFSTFGYFDDETNKKTLQNVARALKPGGKMLVEILNRDYVIADLPTRVWWEGDGCVVLEEVELNYFSSRIQVNRSVVFDDGRQLEQEISVRAYSLHEVGKLMHAAGFRVLEVSGGYQTRGRFFGNQSRHIIVLAERKETTGS